MKKFLSLLIATTLMLSAFASVASATVVQEITSEHKATLTISVEEEATPSSAADTYAANTLFLDPGTYKVYKVNIIAGNLPQLTKASNTSYTGNGITGAVLALGIASSGDFEVDFGVTQAKGAGDWSESKKTYDWYGGSETQLFNNVGVAAGGSQTLTYLEVVVADGTDVEFSFANGKLGAALYEGNRPNQGTGFYNVTTEGGNLEIIAYPAGPDPDPVIDPVGPVAAKASGAALTDLDGNEKVLDADYGIAKFENEINTGLYDYFIVANTATETSDPMPIDFSGAKVEVSGKVSFFAIVKSTHGAITGISLKPVAK